MTKAMTSASTLALACAAALVSTAAIAQTAPEPSQVGDIVVTAQRRTETLQRVPASVEVLSGEQLQAAHINNLSNVQDVSPSLLVTQSSNPSQGVFTVRGIGTAVTDRGFEQSVGVYIDGVFRGRPGAALQDLLDIQRVEVLRGPQSTLFGRNNSAGAINISTSAPDLNKGRMYVEGTYGNYNAVQARMSLSAPLIEDKLAVSFAVSHNSRDGVIDAPLLPQGDVNARDRQSYRGQLLWQPDEATRLRLIADYSVVDDRCCSYLPLFVTDAAASSVFFGATVPAGATRGVSPSDGRIAGTFYRPFDRRTYQNDPSREKNTDRGVSLQLDRDIGSLTLTAIGAHRRFASDTDLDVDGMNATVLNLQSKPSSRVTEDSLEVRLQNQAGGFLEYVVGAYYFHQKLGEFGVLPVRLFVPPAGPLQRYNQIDNSARQTAESYAVFGQATANLTDTVRLTGGLRYLNEEKSSESWAAPGTGTFAGSAKTSDDALMGTAGIAYQPNRAANYYLRYSRGYKSAAINLSLSAPPSVASPVVNPETTDAYEAGAKLRLFNGRLNTNLAVYTQTVNDQQVQSFDSRTSSFLTLNAAKVRSRGAELDAILRLNDWLSVNGSVNYLDAKYVSFPGAPLPAGCGFVNPLGGPGLACPLGAAQDLTGRTPPNAPRWTYVLGASFDKPLTDQMSLLGNVTWRHSSSYYTDLALTEAFRNKDTDALSAGLELAFSNGVGIQLWGRNLTNDDYYLSGLGTPGGVGSLSAFVNEPRTYGLTVRFRL